MKETLVIILAAAWYLVGYFAFIRDWILTFGELELSTAIFGLFAALLGPIGFFVEPIVNGIVWPIEKFVDFLERLIPERPFIIYSRKTQYPKLKRHFEP